MKSTACKLVAMPKIHRTTKKKKLDNKMNASRYKKSFYVVWKYMYMFGTCMFLPHNQRLLFLCSFHMLTRYIATFSILSSNKNEIINTFTPQLLICTCVILCYKEKKWSEKWKIREESKAKVKEEVAVKTFCLKIV